MKTENNNGKKAAKNIRNIRYWVRIYDDNLLDLIDGLTALGKEKYRKKNGIILEALKLGLPELFKLEYGRSFDFEESKNSEKSSNVLPGQMKMNLKRLSHMERTLDEIFVMQNVHERMLATLYNALLIETEGDTVTTEMIVNGLLAELPDEYDEIKKDMLKAYREK